VLFESSQLVTGAILTKHKEGIGMASADLRDDKSTADKYIPCKFLQLPTLLVVLLQDYFGVDSKAPRWLPACADLRYRGMTVPTPLADTLLDKTLEINRFEAYLGVDTNQQIPKILVRRGGVAIDNPGLGNGSRDGMMAAGAVDGILPYQFSGPITTFCLSKQYGQADMLAGEVLMLYLSFLNKLQCELNLISFKTPQMGDVIRLREFPNFFAVPITTDYVYEDNLSVTSNRRIRSIELNLD
jgi:hypothetical protein